jgi:hypothetical protein
MDLLLFYFYLPKSGVKPLPRHGDISRALAVAFALQK